MSAEETRSYQLMAPLSHFFITISFQRSCAELITSRAKAWFQPKTDRASRDLVPTQAAFYPPRTEKHVSSGIGRTSGALPWLPAETAGLTYLHQASISSSEEQHRMRVGWGAIYIRGRQTKACGSDMGCHLSLARGCFSGAMAVLRC